MRIHRSIDPVPFDISKAKSTCSKYQCLRAAVGMLNAAVDFVGSDEVCRLVLASAMVEAGEALLRRRDPFKVH